MTASTSHPGTRATRAARAQAWTLGGVLVGGLAAVTLLAPGSHHYVTCPSLAVGIACPGCGGLRAAESLTHGDVATAWSYNPLVVLGILAALALVIRWIVDARAGREPWATVRGGVGDGRGLPGGVLGLAQRSAALAVPGTARAAGCRVNTQAGMVVRRPGAAPRGRVTPQRALAWCHGVYREDAA